MNAPDLSWAHKIIAEWDRGEYPAKHIYAYRTACEAVEKEPKPHPDAIRKTAYRQDVDG